MSQSNDSGLNLDHLEARARAATPGRWMRLFGERTVYDRMGDGCRGNAIVRADMAYSSQDANNLDFIAAANPAAVLELIALARHYRAQADEALEREIARYAADSERMLKELDALANQPAPTVPAEGAFRAAVRSLMERWHNDAVEAGFGTSEAAADLDELLTAHQPAQEQAERKTWANEQFLTAARVALVSMAHAAEKHGIYQTDYERFSAAVEKFAQQEPVAAPQGDWLWSKLMDWCKKRGVAPANFDDLFAIVGEARAALANQPAPTVPADALEKAMGKLAQAWCHTDIEAAKAAIRRAAHQSAQEQAEKIICLELELMNQREIAQHWKMKALFPAAQQEPVAAPGNDAKDAARYRWLRNPENDNGPWLVGTYGKEELDAEIDRAAQLDGGQEGSAT